LEADKIQNETETDAASSITPKREVKGKGSSGEVVRIGIANKEAKQATVTVQPEVVVGEDKASNPPKRVITENGKKEILNSMPIIGSAANYIPGLAQFQGSKLAREARISSDLLKKENAEDLLNIQISTAMASGPGLFMETKEVKSKEFGLQFTNVFKGKNPFQVERTEYQTQYNNVDLD
jgi:hypothetical protein